MNTTPCPHCGRPINPAALLAARGGGRRKKFTPAERQRRADRLQSARKRRWPHPPPGDPSP